MFSNFSARTKLISLLGFFSCCFYHPSWEYFCWFLLGMLSVTGQKQVTQIYLASDCDKHWTNFHRFLRQYKWNVVQVANRFILFIWIHLLPHLVDELKAPVQLFGIFDDLKIQKSGKTLNAVVQPLSPPRVWEITTITISMDNQIAPGISTDTTGSFGGCW